MDPSSAIAVSVICYGHADFCFLWMVFRILGISYNFGTLRQKFLRCMAQCLCWEKTMSATSEKWQSYRKIFIWARNSASEAIANQEFTEAVIPNCQLVLSKAFGSDLVSQSSMLLCRFCLLIFISCRIYLIDRGTCPLQFVSLDTFSVLLALWFWMRLWHSES